MDKSTAANMGLAKAGGQWLNEVLCIYQTFVQIDSLVLLNTRLRQAPNRLTTVQPQTDEL